MPFRAFNVFLSGVLLPLEAGWCSHLVASVKHTWRKKLLATYRCDRWYYQRHNKHKKTNHFTEIAWSCFLLRTCLDNVHADKSLFHICFFYLPASFSPWCLFIPISNKCAFHVLCGDMFSQRASRRCEKRRRLLASFRGKGYWANVAALGPKSDDVSGTQHTNICVASVEDIYDT